MSFVSKLKSNAALTTAGGMALIGMITLGIGEQLQPSHEGETLQCSAGLAFLSSCFFMTIDMVSRVTARRQRSPISLTGEHNRII